MSDIELVIKIPEELLEYFANHNCMHEDGWFSHSSILLDAFRNGTPLPKGHGKLVDADALLREHPEFDTYPFPSTTINNAPTIIKADKEYEVKIITRGNCMMCGKELVDGLFFCKECENKANDRK